MDGEKRDSNFTHFIAIDFGTYGCGIAVSTNIDPHNVRVYANWTHSRVALKCPTALLLNDEGEFEEFGDKALYAYQSKNRLRRPDKADQYYFFYRYKMCLYNKVRIHLCTSIFVMHFTMCIMKNNSGRDYKDCNSVSGPPPASKF